MLSDIDIANVKDSVTMRELAEKLGFKVDRAGFMACPFHQGDHTASMKLYGGKRGYYCFGCHQGGNIIQFVMQYLNMDFEPATRYIAGAFHIPLEESDNMSKEAVRESARRMELRKAENERIQAERKAKEKRLNDLSKQMQSCQRMLDMFEPMGSVWCRLIQRHQALENEWDGLYEELYGKRSLTDAKKEKTTA